MRLSEQAKTDKKAETDKLPWTWRNWMKWCHFWTYFWNFKEFYSLFIFIALVTRSPLFSKLRTCKVFGTPSTRINVTFGIPPFLSLGECGTREVRTLKTQLGWFLEVSINVSILIIIIQYSGSQAFWFFAYWQLNIIHTCNIPDMYIMYCSCYVSTALNVWLVFVLVRYCLCDSWWMTGEGQRKQQEKLGGWRSLGVTPLIDWKWLDFPTPIKYGHSLCKDQEINTKSPNIQHNVVHTTFFCFKKNYFITVFFTSNIYSTLSFLLNNRDSIQP